MNVTLKSKVKMQPLNSINRPLKPTPSSNILNQKQIVELKPHHVLNI